MNSPQLSEIETNTEIFWWLLIQMNLFNLEILLVHIIVNAETTINDIIISHLPLLYAHMIYMVKRAFGCYYKTGRAQQQSSRPRYRCIHIKKIQL